MGLNHTFLTVGVCYTIPLNYQFFLSSVKNIIAENSNKKATTQRTSFCRSTPIIFKLIKTYVVINGRPTSDNEISHVGLRGSHQNNA